MSLILLLLVLLLVFGSGVWVITSDVLTVILIVLLVMAITGVGTRGRYW